MKLSLLLLFFCVCTGIQALICYEGTAGGVLKENPCPGSCITLKLIVDVAGWLVFFFFRLFEKVAG
jgi:hypothetical protein